MKTLVLPLIVIVLGLVIAKFFFDIDVEELAEGFVDFLGKIFVR